jgi:hypothetical protein
MNKEENKRFEAWGTKIDPAMAEVLNACCDALKVDGYHLLQWFCYTIIRASAPMHNLDPRIQKLMLMLDRDAGWQKAFNLANPDDLDVAQVVLILEQKNHKGFGAVMIDKPWMGEAMRQTECVDDILERVTQVTMRGIYRRLREVGGKLDCQHLSDILLTMIDAQTILELDEGFRAEMPQIGEYDDRGKAIAYGKKTKAKQKRTPDSVARDQRIKFEDIDRDIADYEAKDWEGEWHDR